MQYTVVAMCSLVRRKWCQALDEIPLAVWIISKDLQDYLVHRRDRTTGNMEWHAEFVCPRKLQRMTQYY